MAARDAAARDRAREPMVAGLDHVQIAAPAGCEAQARAFFGGVLGLAELPKPEALSARGGVWFACGDQQLHVGVEPDFAPARKAHPVLRADLSAVRARLDQAGIPRRDAADIPGVERFFVDDPFGNRLEFTEGRPS